MSDRVPLWLDTDPGSDIDDVVALAYLLRQPRCELLGVSTVSGDVVKRAGIVDAVCRWAGRTDVPVFAGLEGPLLTGPGQPHVPHYDALLGVRHRTEFTPGEALPALRRAVRARPGEVVLLTLGPLTNIAVLFALDPELPSLLRGVVSMAGRYFPNPAWEKWSEWNVWCDATAAQIVFDRTARAPLPDAHRLLGLDVTERCLLPSADVRARFTEKPILSELLAMAEVWFRKSDVLTFHDPLAAVSIFHPDTVAFAPGRVWMEPSADEQHASRTYFTSPPTPETRSPHHAARTVDPAAFFARYFDVF